MELSTFASCIIVLVGSNFASGAVHGHESPWGYHHGIDPEHWKIKDSTCDGKQQSPIDIKTDNVKFDPRLRKFNFTDLLLHRDVKVKIHNNGHTVQVDMEDHTIKVTGGGLPGTYIVDQFHFHWGSVDTRGSEHEINGKHFAMEMHVVMHSDRFSKFNDAWNSTRGLAVLGFLVDVGREHPYFEKIISHLKEIKDRDVTLDKFHLESLFPRTDCYYRYYGSLTTPPCYESVIWTIFKEHIYLSKRQLDEFRALGKKLGSEDLINNYRNPQPLNHRVVTTNCIESFPSVCADRGKTGRKRHRCVDYVKIYIKKIFSIFRRIFHRRDDD
ncbi:carbonic anhydrase 1-like [Mytilus californianus]|uniref:carbonic anhydrase 1-like n=1 Tax=Mytilus californianus TaxID=6549 RepID=UPI0022472087|nr:carbonic anhydrase 1-like [Mytilus californianus]